MIYGELAHIFCYSVIKKGRNTEVFLPFYLFRFKTTQVSEVLSLDVELG